MTPEKLSRDQVRSLVRRVQAGERRADVAARFDISVSAVGRYMDMHRMVQKVGPRRSEPYRGRDLSWMGRAKCGDYPSFTEWPVREQVSLCKDDCPVRLECLDHGLRGPSVGGSKADEGPVFGGLSPKRLARLQRQRRLESVAS